MSRRKARRTRQAPGPSDSSGGDPPEARPGRAPSSLLVLALVFLAAHVAAALGFLLDRAPGTGAALVGFPLDDAWIHMVYARSLAALRGFAYNPGHLETGSTSPLWALLLVPASWAAALFHVGIAIPAKLTTVLTACGASLAAAGLLRALGFGMAVQITVGLALAADPSLAFAQVSGMEIMLASALALGALALLARQRYLMAGIAAGLAPLARPEMAMLTAAVLALAQWRLQVARVPARTRAVVLLPTVIAVGGWMTYCLAVSGRPLPSTFYVKAMSGQDYLVHNLALVFSEIVPSSPWFAHGIGVLLWAAGAVALWRRGHAGRLFVLFPWLFFLGVSASRQVGSAWPFYFLRYFLPAQAFLTATVALGAAVIAGWVWARRHARLVPAFAVAACAAVVAALAAWPSALRERAHLYGWNCQNIEELNVAMAVWLRDNVPAGQAIAVNDAGAARYFGEHPILDIVGLNHHRLVQREPAAVREMAEVRYGAFFPSLVPALAEDRTWQPIHRVSTQHLTICRNCQQSEIVAYRRLTAATQR